MIQHPRELVVTKATLDLNAALLKIIEPLTDGETLRVISDVFGGFLSSWAKYAIRDERHGTTEKPGGVK